MKQIFTNTEQNIDIIKDYLELCREDFILFYTKLDVIKKVIIT